jgi:hypothetical protein
MPPFTCNSHHASTRIGDREKLRHDMTLSHRFAEMTPGLRFETLEHGGEYPDTMPQAIKLIDAEGRSCIYVADHAERQGGRQPRVHARSRG